MCRSYHHSEWSNEDTVATVFLLSPLRLSINRLATPLGIDESLAFRVFDKTIIFGHWLWKTRKLALASRAFLLKNTFTISQQTIFKRAKIFFRKKPFPKGRILDIFNMGLYRFPHMLYCFPYMLYRFPHMLYYFPHMLYSFPSHVNIGQKNLISATPLSAFIYIYIYIYIYLLCLAKVFPLH